jgi:hypothetical protein
VVEFTVLGRTLRLRPFTTRQTLLLRLSRCVERQETYEAARFVYSTLLDDGTRSSISTRLQSAVRLQSLPHVRIPLKEKRCRQDSGGREGVSIHVPLRVCVAAGGS